MKPPTGGSRFARYRYSLLNWQYRRRFAIFLSRANAGASLRFTEWRCAPPRISPFILRRVERMHGPL